MVEKSFSQRKLCIGLTPAGHLLVGIASLTDLIQSSAALCNITAVCNVTGTNLAGATVTATTLECLRCLYGTIDYTPQVPDKNMIGVTNYLNEVSLLAKS